MISNSFAGCSACCRLVLCLATIISAGSAGLAFAQSASTEPAPIRQTIDDNGVDLFDGIVSTTLASVSIGDPKQGGLTYSRRTFRTGWIDNVHAYVAPIGTTTVVNLGARSERFTKSGSTYTNTEGAGSTLEFNSGTFTYTTADGTKMTFHAAYPISPRVNGSYDGSAKITSMTTTEGYRIDYLYRTDSVTDGTTYVDLNRLQSVTSNTGYHLHLTYQRDHVTFTDLTPFRSPPYSGSSWEQLVKVTAINSRVDSCEVRANECATTQQWPYVTLGTTVADHLGRSTVYTFTSGNGLTTIRRPGSTSDNYVATHTSNRVSQITSDGVVTTYAYADADGVRTTTVTRGSATQIYKINIASGQLKSYTDQFGKTTSYEYNTLRQLTKVTHPEGNYIVYTRDARGNATQTEHHPKPSIGGTVITTKAGFDADCTYRARCNKPNWTEDAKGNRTEYAYDDTSGTLQTVTAPPPQIGAVQPKTTYSYASIGGIRKLTGISECQTQATCAGTADEVKTTINYGTLADNNIMPSSVSVGAGNGTLTATVSYTYSSMGDVQTLDGPFAGSADTTRYRYDAARRRVGVIGPDPDGAGARKHVATRLTYNVNDQVTVAESGNVNSQSDADWNAFVTAEKVTADYTDGRKMKEVLSSGSTDYIVRQYSYDSLGRLDCTAVRMNSAAFGSLPASACSLGTQGSEGPDRITRTSYDSASRVWKITGGYGTSSAADEVTRTYTDNGLVETLTDARGNRTTYEYDGVDRLLKTRYSSKTATGTSSTSDYEMLSYDANSNVTSVRRRNGSSISFGMDNLNRITVKDLPGSASEDVYFEYDNLGRALSARNGSSSGSGIVNDFDALGRLESVTTLGRTISYQYELAGQRMRVTHPDGFYAQYDFNTVGELTTVSDSTGTTLATYAYDNLGRRSTLTRGNGTSTSYQFDAVSRLWKLTQQLSGTSYDNETTLTYSPASQIATRAQTNDAMYSWTPPGGATVSYTNDGLNQVTQADGANVAHDDLGNLTSGAAASEGSWTYGFDVQNRLRSAQSGSNTVSLAYDPAGMLNQVVVNGVSTSYLYDGANLVAEYNSSGAIQRRYVHGGGADQPLAWYEGSGTSDRRYLYADERGSIVALADNSGAGTTTFRYSPYGNSMNPEAAPFGYTGQKWLSAVGLYYYKARFYSPKLGRFLQPDPIGYADGMNMYGYVSGDPINLTDPTGLEEECPAGSERVQVGDDPNVTICEVTVRGSRSRWDYGYRPDTPIYTHPAEGIMAAFRARGYTVRRPEEFAAPKCQPGDGGFGKASVTDRASSAAGLADMAITKKYGSNSASSAVSGYYANFTQKLDIASDSIDTGKDLLNGDWLRGSAGALDTSVDFAGKTPWTATAAAIYDELGGAKGLVDTYRERIEPILSSGPLAVGNAVSHAMRGDTRSTGCDR